jgi:(p)ppGpp synthase/HD superfamily hydrolase
MRAWTQQGYLDALRFAGQAHAGQTVPGTNLPYVIHVASVAMEVIAAVREQPDCDQELAVRCALLHDVLEDTQTTVEQLQAAFGLAVADGVSALSKNKVLPESQQMQDSLRRIREQPPEVWMVKLADRITNLQPPPQHWRRDKVSSYRDEAMVIRASLEDASRVLARRLSQKIEEYGALPRGV